MIYYIPTCCLPAYTGTYLRRVYLLWKFEESHEDLCRPGLDNLSPWLFFLAIFLVTDPIYLLICLFIINLFIIPQNFMCICISLLPHSRCCSAFFTRLSTPPAVLVQHITAPYCAVALNVNSFMVPHPSIPYSPARQPDSYTSLTLTIYTLSTLDLFQICPRFFKGLLA